MELPIDDEVLDRQVDKLLKELGITEDELLKNLETRILSDISYAIPRFSNKTLEQLSYLLTHEISKRSDMVKSELYKKLKEGSAKERL